MCAYYIIMALCAFNCLNEMQKNKKKLKIFCKKYSGCSRLSSIGCLVLGMCCMLMFGACKSDMEDDGEQHDILAQFMMTLGNTVHVKQKQVTEVVQGQVSPVFRGMREIVMMPFRSSSPVTASDVRYTPNIVLPILGSIPEITDPNTISSRLNAAGNSQVYKDVNIATRTRWFLFYGKAMDEDESYTELQKKEVNGALTMTGETSTSPADIMFSPVPICDALPATATAMAAYLTNIVVTSGWNAVTSEGSPSLFRMLTSVKQLEAGAGVDVLAVLQKIYDAVKSNSDDISTAIVTNMKIGTGENDVLSVSGEDVLSWRNTDYANYPSSLGLPDGAATIKWNSTENRFDVVTSSTAANIGTNNTVPFTQIAFPAPVYYRANSSIAVSNSQSLEELIALYEDADNSWDDILAAHDDGNEITKDTRAVALVDPVKYAVGRLDLRIQASAATLTDANDNEVDMSKIKLTGVLVTGQRPVNFEFVPITTVGTPVYTIYDNQINGNISLTYNQGKSDENARWNHTLVLPTQADGTEYIFFELQNNTDNEIITSRVVDEETVKTIIPVGAKFYVCGALHDDENNKAVFQEASVTKVKATINTLLNAYNVIPSIETEPLLTVELQVAIKDWVNVGEENHDVYNW